MANHCEGDLFLAAGAPNTIEAWMLSMEYFGLNRCQDDHLKNLQHCFVRGLSGKTVVLNGNN